jgi:hypothetical protein
MADRGGGCQGKFPSVFSDTNKIQHSSQTHTKV